MSSAGSTKLQSLDIGLPIAPKALFQDNVSNDKLGNNPANNHNFLVGFNSQSSPSMAHSRKQSVSGDLEYCI